MNELTVLLGTRLSKLREVTYVIQEITATKKTLKTLKKKKTLEAEVALFCFNHSLNI
jgi:hypothetical protein